MNATLARLSRLGADPPADDGSLIDAFLAGDQSAFAALVRRHAGLVFATCRRVLRHQQDAEDAFQATFLVLARRAADVWPREALGAWLFGVAHRVAVKARSVRTRRAARQQPLEEVAAGDAHTPDCDLADAVHRVVCKLPEVYRAAVVACDLEGLSRREAAERLGWPEGTLSGRLARARELLATRFRRAGLSLPAGGLAAVFAVSDGASASVVQTTIDFATGGAACAPAPVAALCEGMVQSMALVKVKTVAAAVFAACVIGFGTVAVGAGVGDGDDKGQKPSQSQSQTQGSVPPAAAKAAPPKPLTDRDRLQGEWRTVSFTEDGKTTMLTTLYQPYVIEIAGDTLKMGLQEAGGSKQEAYAFTLGETNGTKTIDVTAGTGPVVRGLYAFTAPAKACFACHTPNDRFALPADGNFAVCPPGLKQPGLELGVLLAMSTDGKRPEKFGGHGVRVLKLVRAEPKPPAAGPRVELAKQELDALRQELEQAAKNKLDAAARDRLLARLKAVEALLGEQPKPPTPIPAADTERERMMRAAIELQRAKAEVELARAQVERARAEVGVAEAQYKAALDKVTAAEKVAADAAKPKLEPAPADTPTFTIHVRPLNAAEKVTRVKLAGSQTVLDALAHADGVALKPDAVSVWVVRDGTVMPVDLAAITANGDTKTNYQTKAGDQLFVQLKAAK